jgi:precorrin-2 methylase
LAEGDIKDLLVKQSDEAAIRFLDIRDKQVIPAILNNKREDARRIVTGTLKAAYEEHRLKVDEIVQKTNIKNSQVEKEAAQSISTRTASLILIGIIVLGSIMLAAYFLIIKTCYQNQGTCKIGRIHKPGRHKIGGTYFI